jgi:transcriptional regulator with XRE-family HTH domain
MLACRRPCSRHAAPVVADPEKGRNEKDAKEGGLTMDKQVQRHLEEGGYRFMDAEDFLKLTEEERQIVELRLELRRTMRARRRQSGLTQHDVAKKINSSQSRVAKIESGSPDVSLELMFRGFFAVGCTLKDLKQSGALAAVKAKSFVITKGTKATKAAMRAKGKPNAKVKKRLTKA